MQVSEIRVHPIKSCRPVQCVHAVVQPRGLAHDRRYMVTDDTGLFVTLRTLPRLATIDVTILDEHYEVVLPDGPTLELPHELDEGPLVRVGVWRDAVIAREAPQASAALSAWADRPLRLVGMVADVSHRATPDGASPVSFADAYPMLALSRASVDDLSARVGRSMQIDRFRPNLVVDGMAPYEEDTLAATLIGGVPMRGTTLCSRCVATTIDPVTGETGSEPLATLAGYRRFDTSVYFGINLVAEGEGEIAVGDEVRISARHGERPL